MRIALTAPLYTLGSNGQGGIGTFVMTLAKELTQRGHLVDVFTVATSHVEGRIIPIFQEGIFDGDISPSLWVSRDIAGSLKTFEQLQNHEYDVIHNNKVDFFAYLKLATLPRTITTYHQDDKSPGLQLARELDPTISQAPYVSISLNQQKSLDLNFVSCIPNGIDLSQFTYSEETEPYLAWLGRIEPAKGITEALGLANQSGVTLKFAGSKRDEIFYEETLQRAQALGATYLGHADSQLRDQLLGRSRAFLFPLQWEEPFGLAVIEAMACGTPVITYDRGAMSQLIIDGQTGFICQPGDTAAMQLAIQKIMSMPEEQYRAMRRACRTRVEELYTVDKMVTAYEEIYATIAKED